MTWRFGIMGRKLLPLPVSSIFDNAVSTQQWYYNYNLKPSPERTSICSEHIMFPARARFVLDFSQAILLRESSFDLADLAVQISHEREKMKTMGLSFFSKESTHGP